jgi:hypothetical protein
MDVYAGSPQPGGQVGSHRGGRLAAGRAFTCQRCASASARTLRARVQPRSLGRAAEREVSLTRDLV